jgi:hypothetical protein
MTAKLVTLGDSLTHGFQHGAIRRTEWSYPALVARVLGDPSFRQPDFSGGGVGGPLVDLELLMRRLTAACGDRLGYLEIPKAALTIQRFMSEVEDFWERGAGTEPSATGPIHRNLGVWGFEVLDALTLSDGVCFRNTPPATDNLINQLPELGMYRSARRVFNPSQEAALAEYKALDLARQIAKNDGGIEHLIVELGSNNALGTCVRMKLEWSHSADFRKLAHQRSCTIWEPEHFSRIYRRLAEQITQVGARRVFLATVPHVTVAPVTRGVSPFAKQRGLPELARAPGAPADSRGYFEYYTRFWIWDEDFNPSRDPFLAREDAILIDSVIDEYNECIRAVAEERGFHVIDLCRVLDDLAYRSNDGHPPYRFPVGLIEALRQNPATAFRVRADGTVLLDTRYFQVPDRPPPADAPGAEWQEQYTGGLFGLDGVHPTTIGYGVIAHEVLSAMRAQGVTEADPARLPWAEIVAADTLVTDPPPILASLARTLDVLFGKLGLERLIDKLAGYGAEGN